MKILRFNKSVLHTVERTGQKSDLKEGDFLTKNYNYKTKKEKQKKRDIIKRILQSIKYLTERTLFFKDT